VELGLRMSRIEVCCFGAFHDDGALTTLLSGNGWAVSLARSLERPVAGGAPEPSVLLAALGERALAGAGERDLFLERLSVRKQGANIGLICDGAGDFDTEFYANFDDFIFWPCSRKELITRVSRFIEARATPQAENLHVSLLEDFAAVNLLGVSKVFLRLVQFIRRIARCDATVLIEGETGTGKENAARAVHYLSDRREYGFIPVNCGAIPDNLLESELFGHDKGAFTDAKASQPGLVELASRGTLFLDEVDTLSLKAQAALLRFLQTHEYRPLGGRRLKHADVRVVAATNANLAEKVENGAFRSDLLFRLRVLTVLVPPLRDRAEDIALIANSLLARYADQYHVRPKTLHPKSLEWLRRQPWPGNVRELENVLLREFLLADGNVIRIGQENEWPGQPSASRPDAPSFREAKEAAINAFEIDYVNQVLELTSGNVTAAAKIAGKERRAFGKLIKKYNVDKKGFGRRPRIGA
jgi:DNA-binding NtrC family response regulator